MALAEPPQPAPGALELRRPDLLRARPQGGDLGDDVPRGLPLAEASGLLRDDRLRARCLATPRVETLRHNRLEVVDVVEIAPLQLVDLRIEVARHRDVDQEQRSTLSGREHPLYLRAGDDEARGAGRRDDDVGL